MYFSKEKVTDTAQRQLTEMSRACVPATGRHRPLSTHTGECVTKRKETLIQIQEYREVEKYF